MDVNNKAFDNLRWINNLIGVNLNPKYANTNNNYDLENIKFKFGDFTRPNLNKDNLYIVVDHSFEYETEDNVIFLDHHLIEEIFGISYCSNADLLFKNYTLIFQTIKEILNNFNFNDVVVFMHHDIDGVCSGLITKKLLCDVSIGIPDANYAKKIKLAQVFGNFGDISPTAMVELSDIFNDESSIDIYTKKIKAFCSHFSRFIKATRVLFNDFNDNDFNTENIKSFNSFIKEYNINTNDIYQVINNVCENIETLKDIDTKILLNYFNYIVIDKTIRKVVEAFIIECDKYISACINPEKNDPSFFETMIQFKSDPNSTKFRFLTINMPFDCGRTIIWKYRYQLSKINDDAKIGKVKKHKYYYKIIDWKNINDNVLTPSSADNIMCYNMYLDKLSIDGNNSSAFLIAQELGGGGHGSIEDGRSIGSVVIDDINDVLSNSAIIEIF